MEYNLKILGKSPTTSTHVRVIAECICGNVKSYRRCQLRSRHTTSCGCRPTSSSPRHGLTMTTEHSVWRGMNSRCNSSKDKNWSRYGGRGISVCERWKVFEYFYVDMGKRPDGKQLDRIDNNKDYSPDNCRWTTPRENTNNRENSIKLEVGFFPSTVSQLAKLALIKPDAMRNRWYRCGNIWECLFPFD